MALGSVLWKLIFRPDQINNSKGHDGSDDGCQSGNYIVHGNFLMLKR